MPQRSSREACRYTSLTLVWSMTSKPSGLWREAASFAKKRLVPTPIEQRIHSPTSLLKRFLISRPMSTTVPEETEGVSQVNDGFINGFGGHVRGVVAENFAEHQMDCSVFCRVRGQDDNARVEEFCISDRHTGFDTVLLGLDRRGDDAAVRAVVGGDDNGFAAEEGICLLFNGREARI